MEKFVVLCSSSALPFFQSIPGYSGAIYYDKKTGEHNISFDDIPNEIRIVLVEDNNLLMKIILNHEVFLKKIVRVIILNGDEKSINLLAEFSVQHFETIQYYTNTWISQCDAISLADGILRSAIHKKGLPLRGMEIGSWLGCSSYVTANILRMISPNVILYCVDTWNHWSYCKFDPFPFSPVGVFDPFKMFLQNSIVFDFNSIIRPMKMLSDEAFSIIGMEHLDFVFIDGNHAYSHAYPDILNSVLRIRDGGILIGHDCEFYADEVDKDHMEKNLEKDFTFISPDQGCHYGVIKALGDIFDKQFIIYPGSSIWCKIIEKDDKIHAKSLLDDWNNGKNNFSNFSTKESLSISRS